MAALISKTIAGPRGLGKRNRALCAGTGDRVARRGGLTVGGPAVLFRSG